MDGKRRRTQAVARSEVWHWWSSPVPMLLFQPPLPGACALPPAGQFGQVDWGGATSATDAVTLPGPHDWRPHQLLCPLASAMAQLAADRPWLLLEGLCSSVCSAVDHGVLQVCCWRVCSAGLPVHCWQALHCYRSVSIGRAAGHRCCRHCQRAADCSLGGPPSHRWTWPLEPCLQTPWRSRMLCASRRAAPACCARSVGAALGAQGRLRQRPWRLSLSGWWWHLRRVFVPGSATSAAAPTAHAPTF